MLDPMKKESTSRKITVCTNADGIVEQIQELFPDETNNTIGAVGGVGKATVQSWKRTGRADCAYFDIVHKVFTERIQLQSSANTPLSRATARELYLACEAKGWAEIFASMRK